MTPADSCRPWRARRTRHISASQSSLPTTQAELLSRSVLAHGSRRSARQQWTAYLSQSSNQSECGAVCVPQYCFTVMLTSCRARTERDQALPNAHGPRLPSGYLCALGARDTGIALRQHTLAELGTGMSPGGNRGLPSLLLRE